MQFGPMTQLAMVSAVAHSSGDGLAPNRRHWAITWTKEDAIQWNIYVPSLLNELISQCDNVSFSVNGGVRRKFSSELSWQKYHHWWKQGVPIFKWIFKNKTIVFFIQILLKFDLKALMNNTLLLVNAVWHPKGDKPWTNYDWGHVHIWTQWFDG